jgi:hypothetical protein
MRGIAHRVSFILILLGLFSFATSTSDFADAKAKKEIETKMKEAMENYDLLEYEEARKILNQALTVAKKAKMESDPGCWWCRDRCRRPVPCSSRAA